MAIRKCITEYTEAEFVNFIHKILAINEGGSDEELGELMMQFRQLAGHPDGTDLIFYPENGADDSPEGITKTVNRVALGQPPAGVQGDIKRWLLGKILLTNLGAVTPRHHIDLHRNNKR